MAKNNKEKTYWPHMILGFLAVGVTLSYWTVKSASSMPVQESNDYMLKYQIADMHINEILQRKALFDKNYNINIVNVKSEIIELSNTKRAKNEKVVILEKGINNFSYTVSNKQNSVQSDANVSFLLTRPHSVKEDMEVSEVSLKDGKFTIENIDIEKAGRYTLQLRVKIGEAIGYSQIPAYLKP